jgi:hypothetical protein
MIFSGVNGEDIKDSGPSCSLLLVEVVYFYTGKL